MDNPYLIKGTGVDTPGVLKNKLGITDAAEYNTCSIVTLKGAIYL